MNNPRIADALDLVADLLEFKGENPFRVRAYRTGAQVVRDLPEPVSKIIADPSRKLTDMQGIGKDLAEKVATLAETGRLPMLEDLKAEIPDSVMALLRVQGLGPKRAAILFRDLQISTLDMLRAACEAHRIRDLKGFGAKTEEKILAGIDLAATGEQRMLWAEADQHAQFLLQHMRRLSSIEKMEIAGSYRRGCETIGDLDLLVVSTSVDQVMDHFGSLVGTESVLGRGPTKMSIRLTNHLQVDVRVVPAESFGAALQYFTGSKQHNIVLRGRAKDRGLKVNEYGVFRLVDGREELVAGRTEEDVYAALDLPCFPPELREARREFEWADAGRLPNLIEREDLQGDLHMHTTATDGRATLEQMATAAQAIGLQYIAITDHSKRVSMANGLDADRLRLQWAEIDRIRPQFPGLTILKGVEVDILERGGLDLDDDVLGEAAWVVASLHYGQNQPRDQIMSRLLEAIAHPHVSAIAHPTGRIIGRRKPYDVDVDALIQAAREHGKLLELNCNPARLDLDDVACAAAKNAGVPIVMSTDAHSIEGLGVSRYGILQARRAGLTKQDVANTRPWEKMRPLIGRRPK